MPLLEHWLVPLPLLPLPALGLQIAAQRPGGVPPSTAHANWRPD